MDRPSRLALSLLGPPRFARGGEPVSGFSLQKARALLVFLAMEPGQDHSRESLVGLLWPDQGESASRMNLRQVLANLREAIDDSRAHPPFLTVGRETIRLDLSPEDQVDVRAFGESLDACRRHAHRDPDRCRSCARRREKAVALYRGDFLQGFHLKDAGPFEEWAALQRERLHRKMVDALGGLATFHEAAGDLEAAEALVTRQLALDAWMEEAHRERIRLLARLGRRSQALAQYEACRKVLAQELGVEPSAETVQLVEQVRDGSFVDASDRPSGGVRLAIQGGGGLIGRESELDELTDLLEDPAHRLVTITGSGGVGKTRMAIAAAEAVRLSFRDGIAFIPLTDLDAGERIPAEILSRLEVSPAPGEEPRAALARHLRDRQILLVLDGIEHLLPDARALAAELLQGGGQASLLVTSQERLGLRAEWRYDLGGLGLPSDDDPEGAKAAAAVRLFFERGRQVNHRLEVSEDNLAHVARISRLAEGVPLAIELAASAVGFRDVAEIVVDLEEDLRRLESRLSDVPERHRSQAAAFDYSWRLLEPELGDRLLRLSVFRGGWDEAAARAVAETDAEVLEKLSDKSLIRRDQAGRYSFHPLLQKYAAERLRERGGEESAGQAHYEHFAALAGEAVAHLAGEQQVRWLARLDHDLGNLRGALDWGLRSGRADSVSALCLSLSRFWMIRGLLAEGQEWIEKALSLEPGPALRAKLHNRAGILAAMRRRVEEAHAHLSAAVEQSRQLGDRLSEVTSLNSLGAMSIEQQDYDRARAYLESCLPAWDELGNENGLASTLNNLGVVALMGGETQAALGRFEESLLIFRKLGDRRMIAGVLYNIGDLSLKAGESERARRSLRESLELRRTIGDVAGVAETLEGMAMVGLDVGRASDAARLLGAAATLREEAGAPIAPVNQADYERMVEGIRGALGREALDAAWRAGRGLARDEAIALGRSI